MPEALLPPGGATAPAPQLDAGTIAGLQASAMLLLRHASGLTDRSLGAGWEQPRPQGLALPPQPPAPTLDAFLADMTALLALPPSTLAARPTDAAKLFAAVDYLSGLVEPASAETIALTAAFADPLLELPEPFRRLGACGRRLRRSFFRLRVAAVVTLFLAMTLIIHVVWGQSVAETLKGLRQEQEAIWTQMALVAPAEQGGNWVPLCARRTSDGKFPVSERQARLCGTLDDIGLRTTLAYGQLRIWNGITDRLLAVLSPLRWMGRDIGPGFEGDSPRPGQWASTEQRTAVMLTELTVYVVPVLVGLLGAFAYVFRRINLKVERFTLEARDRMQAGLRIFLGTLLGGLVGLFFQPDGIELAGVRLSIAALAFLVGYSVQVAFEAMDLLVAFAVRVLQTRTTASGEAVRRPADT